MEVEQEGEELGSQFALLQRRGTSPSGSECLLDQADLPVSGNAEGPEVARLDPVLAEACDQSAHVNRAAVHLGDQSVSGQFPQSGGINATTLSDLGG